MQVKRTQTWKDQHGQRALMQAIAEAASRGSAPARFHTVAGRSARGLMRGDYDGIPDGLCGCVVCREVALILKEA